MKQVLFMAALLAFSNTSLASTGSDALYLALNVQEQSLPAPRTQVKTLKSAGGLVCIKTNDIRIGESTACSFTISQADSLSLYASLDVAEETLPSNRMEFKTQKTAGSLTCIRTNHIVKGDWVDCSFSL